MRNRTLFVRPAFLFLGSLLFALCVTIGSPVDAKGPPKDKGEASMKIGEKLWEASRASAYYKQGRLKILASWSKTIDGKRVRQALKLSIPEFTGPGTYQLKGASSNFTAVGLNLDQLGDESEAAAQKMLMGALSKSTVLLLEGGKLTIVSEEGDQVKGTFSWAGRPGQSPISEGEFRAVVKKRE